MQCVFHLQHYCVNDADVIWDAEFEDMVLINAKKERIYDHSKLSWWRAVWEMTLSSTQSSEKVLLIFLSTIVAYKE